MTSNSYINVHHAHSTKSPAESGQTGKAADPGPAVEKRRSPLPGRRLVLHFSRLSCAAADQPQVGRLTAQCRLRLLQYAVEAPAGYEIGGEAHASRGRVRSLRAHVPHRNVSRLQGASAGPAR